jgi:hypothetical protein
MRVGCYWEGTMPAGKKTPKPPGGKAPPKPPTGQRDWFAGKIGDLLGLTESLTKITLPGGVVGKMSRVLICVAGFLAFIAYMGTNPWVQGSAVLTILILVLVLGWRLITFAENHPQAALMEGAELLLHEQMQLAAKGQPEIPFIPAESTSEPGALPPPGDVKLIEAPDEESSGG